MQVRAVGQQQAEEVHDPPVQAIPYAVHWLSLVLQPGLSGTQPAPPLGNGP